MPLLSKLNSIRTLSSSRGQETPHLSFCFSTTSIIWNAEMEELTGTHYLWNNYCDNTQQCVGKVATTFI